MTTLDALNAGLKFINEPTMENAVAMTEPISNGWTKKFDELERLCEKSIADNALLREALEVACEETEVLARKNCGDAPCCYFDYPMFCLDNHCNDCGVCLQNYFIQKAQENLDRERNNEQVHDEIEGRKVMDAQEVKKEQEKSMFDIMYEGMKEAL